MLAIRLIYDIGINKSINLDCDNNEVLLKRHFYHDGLRTTILPQSFRKGLDLESLNIPWELNINPQFS